MLQSFQGSKKAVTVGPWGSQYSQYGCQWDDGVNYSGIKQIVITYGSGIHSIQIEYDYNGSSVWSQKHGGSGGFKTEKVKLNHPEEFLISVHGYYFDLYDGGSFCIQSLTFESNINKFGPYGIEQGTYFSSSLNEHMIISFHGRFGLYLDAIGAHMKPIKNNNPSKCEVYSNSIVPTEFGKYGHKFIPGNIGHYYGLKPTTAQYGNRYRYKLQDDHFPLPPPYDSNSNQSLSCSKSDSSSESSDNEKNHKKLALPSTKVKRCLENGGPVTCGPWGGKGGIVFDDGVYTGIRQIHLSRNMYIVYIKVLYDRNGLPVWGTKNGGTGGFKTNKIVFDYPFEVLTHLTGYYGPVMFYGPNTLQSLTFHTTKGKYGPYGEEQGTAFSTNLKSERIVGFHGRVGMFVDAIGVHVAEGKVIPPTRPPSESLSHDNGVSFDTDNLTCPTKSSTTIINHSTTSSSKEILYRVVKIPSSCGWGGDSGKPWDDGVYTEIRHIFLTRSEGLCSIQIEYGRNNQSVWSTKHGGNSGTTTYRIKLECPDEVLTSVSGYYGSISRDDHTKVIRSLTFYTSRGKYGPFGEEIGTYFTSVKTEGKVVGFHGRSGMYVNAIGVYMQHWSGGLKPNKPYTFFKMLD